MRRRALLASLTAGVAGLAGCSLLGDDAPTATPYEVPSSARNRGSTETSADSGRQSGGSARVTDQWAPQQWDSSEYADSVRLGSGSVRVEIAPQAYRTTDGLLFAVTFTQSSTADHPARLLLALYNESKGPQTVSLDRFPVLGIDGARSDAAPEPSASSPPPGDQLLVPTGRNPDLDAGTPVERGEDGFWYSAHSATEGPLRTVSLSVGESYLSEYHLVGDAPDHGPAYGIYRFESTYRPTTDTFVDSVVSPPPVAARRLTVVRWNSEAPGPPTPGRFPDADPPPLEAPFTDRPTSWRASAHPDGERYVLPGSQQVTLPATLPVRAVDRLPTWNVPQSPNRVWTFKRADGRWRVLTEQRLHGDRRPYDGVAAFDVDLLTGRTPTVGTTGQVDQLRRGARSTPAVGSLGAGRYAVAVDFRDDETLYLVAVDAEGTREPLRPDPGLTTTREGDRVVATAPGIDDPESAPQVARTERVDTVDAYDLLPEQLGQPWAVAARNTLLLYDDGVEAVDYYFGDHPTRARLEGLAGVRPLRYEGTTAAFERERR